MPSINMTNNRESVDYVSVDIEASPAEDDEPAGLALTIDDNDGTEISIWETQADAIRELRDKVVAECDKALAELEG